MDRPYPLHVPTESHRNKTFIFVLFTKLSHPRRMSSPICHHRVCSPYRSLPPYVCMCMCPNKYFSSCHCACATGISCCHRAYLQSGHRESPRAALCLPRQLRRNDGGSGRATPREVAGMSHVCKCPFGASSVRWPWLAGFDRNFWPDCWVGMLGFRWGFYLSTVDIMPKTAKRYGLIMPSFDKLAQQTIRNACLLSDWRHLAAKKFLQ